ncbi:DUF983 domain-containing protein [Aquamicrobium sp. NLF2-7]|jgi:uncharacterized protein (DUF983 family)|uniref:Uncharacterized protein (DUF983 family) n=1 Tax=Aquamicrobium lusatiense TaxID=89772 RepID=A0A7W9VUX9_9HYPH|nr:MULTISPECIES: DUF983 domain-containing protein [Aquamicrobium]MBB6012498.1 uncharacterized protein (DUF983 family) [Aquamicrobium lusatiense]MCG8269991.1 DUF983 domain-containing protein [Aquamicrobium sp. NLF2-7]MCK9551272.1 DUF983 domain-containing protein [Aquamicrobium sp.]MDH4992976.1 DUF983 domain-containing protein [Aquamicrobium lusatiense]
MTTGSTEQQVFGGDSKPQRPTRPVGEAMKRGFLGRCPACGEGKLFRAYVKSVDTCSVCGEEISHHRADDLPAYLDIVVVGHIVIAGFMAVEMRYVWPMWAHFAVWAPLTLILALLFLQPIKGAVIGLQWAFYMHGFGDEPDQLEPHPEH